jgi:hypothetical protein
MGNSVTTYLTSILPRRRGTFKGSNKSVSFGAIEVREYDRILGARQEIPFSLSLGWEYQEKQPIPLDGYEETVWFLPTTIADRCAILLSFGFSLQELNDSEIHDNEEEVAPKQKPEPNRRGRGRALVGNIGRKMKSLIVSRAR